VPEDYISKIESLASKIARIMDIDHLSEEGKQYLIRLGKDNAALIRDGLDVLEGGYSELDGCTPELQAAFAQLPNDPTQRRDAVTQLIIAHTQSLVDVGFVSPDNPDGHSKLLQKLRQDPTHYPDNERPGDCTLASLQQEVKAEYTRVREYFQQHPSSRVLLCVAGEVHHYPATNMALHILLQATHDAGVTQVMIEGSAEGCAVLQEEARHYPTQERMIYPRVGGENLDLARDAQSAASELVLYQTIQNIGMTLHPIDLSRDEKDKMLRDNNDDQALVDNIREKQFSTLILAQTEPTLAIIGAMHQKGVVDQIGDQRNVIRVLVAGEPGYAQRSSGSSAQDVAAKDFVVRSDIVIDHAKT
jgi:hypothetical protein